jgi:hypothetical protein
MKFILYLLLVLLSAGAMGGGTVMILSPSGEWIGMSISMLGNAPFQSYLVPGLVLFSLLGMGSAGLVYALVRRPECKICTRLSFHRGMHWSWNFCIYLGFALMIWIQIQMAILQTVYWLQTFFAFYGMLIVILLLLPEIRNPYQITYGRRAVEGTVT